MKWSDVTVNPQIIWKIDLICGIFSKLADRDLNVG